MRERRGIGKWDLRNCRPKGLMKIDQFLPGAYAPGYILSPLARPTNIKGMDQPRQGRQICSPVRERRGIGKWDLRNCRPKGLMKIDQFLPGAYAPGYILSPLARPTNIKGMDQPRQGRQICSPVRERRVKKPNFSKAP